MVRVLGARVAMGLDVASARVPVEKILTVLGQADAEGYLHAGAKSTVVGEQR